MPNRLSFSAINMFNTCAKKYDFHYNQRLRPKKIGSALIFGSAIDESLNELLTTGDLPKSLSIFDKTMNFQSINGIYTDISTSPLIKYFDMDMDVDFLQDKAQIEIYRSLFKKKKSEELLTDEEQSSINYLYWLSLRAKGRIMIESYSRKVIPKISKTLAVQYKTSLTNQLGDQIVQIIDAIVVWEDGSVLLIDNKTSSKEYEEDSAGKSPQLISYYHKVKQKFGIEAVGFVVLQKHLRKNKTKVCSKCQTNGTSSRARTCDIVLEDGTRCNGDWNITLDPDCIINLVINTVSPEAEDMVLDSFEQANESIKTGAFEQNFNSCKAPFLCPYYNKCHNQDDSELIIVEKKE